MPRSILFLKHYGKDIIFIPHSVISNDTNYKNIINYFKLGAFLFEEYTKYLVSYIILQIY